MLLSLPIDNDKIERQTKVALQGRDCKNDLGFKEIVIRKMGSLQELSRAELNKFKIRRNSNNRGSSENKFLFKNTYKSLLFQDQK